MKKATKGALAAAAAGSLMLGGAGSLAYWTSTGTIDGGSITSGHLTLQQGAAGPACDAAWQLHEGTTTSAYSTTSPQVLTPGDYLTRHCSYTVSMSGHSITANLAISAPDFEVGGNAALTGDLDLTHHYTYDADGSGVGTVAPVDVANDGTVAGLIDGSVIDTAIQLDFKNIGAVNNASNLTGANLTAALQNITVTATQVP